MTFLECLNRILRSNALIRGDTDPVVTFSDTAHNAAINLCMIAVQDEIVHLIAKRLIPKERRTSGSITLLAGTRVYNLDAAFTGLYGIPHFYYAAGNRQIYEYPGGLEGLQIEVFDYATQSGSPNWWYWEPSNAAAKQIGLFLVPDADSDAQVWTYDFQTSVLVSVETDNLPFHNDEENFVFSQMAGRRFKYMFEDVKNEGDIQNVLEKDQTYRAARSNLMLLIRGQAPSSRYGSIYA